MLSLAENESLDYESQSSFALEFSVSDQKAETGPYALHLNLIDENEPCTFDKTAYYVTTYEANVNLCYLLCNFKVYIVIIPTPHHYAYFTQFGWLEKMFYTPIHSKSMNSELVSFRQFLKCKIMSTKKWFWCQNWNDKESIIIFVDTITCKLWRITHKLNIRLYSVCEWFAGVYTSIKSTKIKFILIMFKIWFWGQDVGSDCISSWSLLIFLL